MVFREIDIKDKQIFDEYLLSSEDVYKDFLASEASFENLFIWNIHNNIEISIEEKAIYLKAEFGNAKFYLPPIVKDKNNFVQAVNELYLYHKTLNNGQAFLLKAFSNYFVDILQNSQELLFKTRVGLDRNNSDYIYDTEEFCLFKGKKFHAKRNHINNFIKNYTFEVKDYTSDKRADIQSILNKWEENGGGLEESEIIALNRALDYYEELGLVGIVVYVSDKPVAFEIGKITLLNVGICFFEKADIDFTGIFSFVSNLFVKSKLSNTRYINRQEDMGMEGLRKSKLSYNPVFLFNKYSIEEE